MNKKIIISLSIIAAVAAVVVGGTVAFFSDTEASEGNIFTAGNIDLKIDHSWATYNGENCSQNCLPKDDAENLLANSSFEEPVVTDNGGGWELYSSIPGWELVAGDAIELQRDVFTSADGQQHLELDSHGSDSASAVQQEFDTTAGQRYQLSFAWSPRPDSQADGSEAELDVEMVSEEGSPFSTKVIETGQGSINWQYETYEFVAISSETTVKFSHGGPMNTYGGLVDDVEVLEMECESLEQENWNCELWELKDLQEDEKFFNFNDIKPGDWGTNVISYHVYDNDAHVCMIIDENTPQATTTLSSALEFVVWEDDGYGNYPGSYLHKGTINNGDLRFLFEDVIGSTDNYLGLFWCAGEIEDDEEDDSLSCNGTEMGNEYQGTQMTADLIFYAIQSRHNEDFNCDDADWEAE